MHITTDIDSDTPSYQPIIYIIATTLIIIIDTHPIEIKL